MLIVSKFHDYYDTAVGMGVDKTVVYERATDDSAWREVTQSTADHRFNGLRVGRDRWNVSLFCAEVGFCGTWYPAVRADVDAAWPARSPAPAVFYTPETLAEFMHNCGIAATPRHRARWRTARSDLILQGTEACKAYFKPYEDETLFRKHKCPVLVRRTVQLSEFADRSRATGHYAVNPRLADWQFQKVKDPFAAFQEIFMFISGVLGVNTREIITLLDVDKIHKHGFDKFSFRKGKGT